MTIRAMIVDDEPLARRRIRRLLRGSPDVVVTGEFGNGRDALAALSETPADLLFLDVQMPELGGLELIARLPAERAPVIIFTTAYDEYAVSAFEVHAVDYLLKPFARPRFEQALERARARLGPRAPADARSLTELLAELRQREEPGRLLSREGGRIRVLPLDDVEWIEADGNYARAHVGTASHPLREGIGDLAARMDARRFPRVHRSAIVNVAHVVEIQPWFRGDFVLILRSGARVTLSRTHRLQLEEALGRRL
jgi:two-component system, LytTR family, response regulator